MDAKKMTAVEWLQEPLLNILTNQQQMQVIGLFQQAKAMEKEQIIDANEDCSTNELGELLTGKQYYNETYGD